MNFFKKIISKIRIWKLYEKFLRKNAITKAKSTWKIQNDKITIYLIKSNKNLDDRAIEALKEFNEEIFYGIRY